eukprot:m51a1_g1522 hypothetical protein (575) ;mRNA; f:440947-444774
MAQSPCQHAECACERAATVGAPPPVIPGTVVFNDVFEATKVGAIDYIRKFVEQNREANVNAADSDGATILHWACYKGQPHVVEYLLSQGANVNSTTVSEGQSPLHWAAISGFVQIVHYLVKNGADIAYQDKRGYSILHHAVQYGHALCVFYGLQKGLAIDAPDLEGHTPLMWAAYQGHEDLIVFLVQRGASVALADKSGYTALHWSASRGAIACTQELLRAGAAVDAKNSDGETPEAVATKKNNVPAELTKSQRFWGAFGFLAVPVPLLALALLPWYVSAVVVGFMAYGARKFLVGTCPGPDTRTPLWVCWFFGMFIMSFAVYVLSIAPALFSSSPLSHVGFVLVNALFMYYYVGVVRSDPGVLPQGSFTLEELERHLEQLIPIGDICPTCLIVKPLRSKHCRACNRCVARFDHHCVWLDNCVGQANHRGFIAVLVLVCTLHVWFIYFLCKYIGQTLEVPAKSTLFALLLATVSQKTLALGLLFFHGMHCMWESYILAGQAYGIAKNITTNEAMHWPRYFYMRNHNGKFFNPFDKGPIRNVREFFGNARDYSRVHVADLLHRATPVGLPPTGHV